MALKRFEIEGYGQLELNQVAFRRSGRIEAQCELDATDFAEVPAENGMLLAVNNITRTVGFAKTNNVYPIALNYTTEHMYDERHNALKDFKLERGEFLPRLGYLGAGDKYTTNCLAYDDQAFTNDEALKNMLNLLGTKTGPAAAYAEPCENGAHKITTAKTDKTIAMVIGATTMPDGQFAVKFQAL